MTDAPEAINETVEVETPTETTPTQETQTAQADLAQAQPQASEEVTEEQGVERKPTRSERRVEQLLRKLKDRPSTEDLPHMGADEPLIRPEELETGVDPQALEYRFNQKLQNATAQTRSQIKAEIAYENEVSSHMADLESAADGLDQRIEKLAVRQYQALNYQFNPITGQQVFVPTVKFSEIVKQVQADLEDITASRVAESAERVAKIAQEGAIQPGIAGKQSLGLDDLQKNIWKSPELVAKELESRLSYSKD